MSPSRLQRCSEKGLDDYNCRAMISSEMAQALARGFSLLDGFGPESGRSPQRPQRPKRVDKRPSVVGQLDGDAGQFTWLAWSAVLAGQQACNLQLSHR